MEHGRWKVAWPASAARKMGGTEVVQSGTLLLESSVAGPGHAQSTHKGVIYHPLHPDYGRKVVVIAKFKNGSVRVRDDETGAIFDVRGWMIDPLFCKEIREVETAYTSVKALLELAELVGHQRHTMCSKMDVVQAKECIDEQAINAPSHGEEPGQELGGRGCGGFEKNAAGKLEGRET